MAKPIGKPPKPKQKQKPKPTATKRKRPRKLNGGATPPFLLTAAPPATANENGNKNTNVNKNGNGNASNDATVTTTTADDVLSGVANLLAGKKNIVVLVGAGISTSVGIPDFRSRDKGLYNTLDAGALGLSCPEDLFCIEFFKYDPAPFYKFAKQLYYPNSSSSSSSSSSSNDDDTGNRGSDGNNGASHGHKTTPSDANQTAKPTRASRSIRRSQRAIRTESPLSSLSGDDQHQQQQQQQQQHSSSNNTSNTAAAAANAMARPSDSHKLLALLEKHKMLLRVYTQNIDGLESSAGVSDSKIVYCHGSLRSMSCTRCNKKKLPLTPDILASIAEGSVPFCRAAKTKTKSKTKSKTVGAGNRPRASASAGSNASSSASANASVSAGGEANAPGMVRSPTRTSQRQRTRKRPRSREADEDGEGSGTSNHQDNSNININSNSNHHHHHHHDNNHNHHNNENKNVNENKNENSLCGGVLKPGITFFGETLDGSVGRKIESDQNKADALIVIGTSLSVAPISRVIEYLPRSIPRILINRTIVHPQTTSAPSTTTTTNESSGKGEWDDKDFRTNYVFDAYLLGFCDDVTRALGKQMGLGFDVGTGRNGESGGGGNNNENDDERNKPNNKRSAKTKRGGSQSAKATRTTAESTTTTTTTTTNNKRHASATAAKLLPSAATTESSSSASSSSSPSSPSSSSSSRTGEWSSVTVPRERVVLFPGALDTTVGDSENGNGNDGNGGETYHEVAHCDGCSLQIPGGMPVYKCCDCFDYDLCQGCYPIVSKRHGNGRHAFRKE